MSNVKSEDDDGLLKFISAADSAHPTIKYHLKCRGRSESIYRCRLRILSLDVRQFTAEECINPL